MAIPFRSLRYSAGRDQVWGVNFRRIILGKNELTTLTPVPASYGNPGVMHVSLAATLVGLQAPPPGTGLEIKPHALTSLTTDRTATPTTSNDPDGDAGFDLKYNLTRGSTLDFTFRTDFAQVKDRANSKNAASRSSSPACFASSGVPRSADPDARFTNASRLFAASGSLP